MATLNVKSADRVLQLLMLFSEAKHSLRASEVAKDLHIPLSSCMELLATLVNSGFMTVDHDARSYMPTDKVAALGDWLRPGNPLEIHAIACARRVHRELGVPVAVSHRAGLFINWNFTLAVKQVYPGYSIPLLRTLNGIVLLSRMNDVGIIDIVSAHNERFGRQGALHSRDLLARAQSARGRDYASGPSPMFPGVATVCFYLGDTAGPEELLLSIVLPASELAQREARVVGLVRKYIRERPAQPDAQAAPALS